MVARIHSLYLLLAGLLAATTICFHFWSFNATTLFYIGYSSTFPDAGIMQMSNATGILSLLTAIISVTAIFLFKNRSLQSRFVQLAMLLIFADILSVFTAAHFMNQYFQHIGTTVTHKPEAGFFMLLPEPVLFWLALKGIKKDDKIANAYKRL
ncbi:MAG: DUF4293 domain-containing protein [Chlorobiaceae bacterium]